MRNKGQLGTILAILVVVIALVAITFFTLSDESSENSADTITKNTATRFTIERVAEGAVIIRNDGTRPLEKGDVALVVNGYRMEYEQEEPIQPGQPGALQLPLVPGDCEVKVEVLGGFSIRSTDANMCFYEETFDTDPEWNNTGVNASVADGTLTVKHNGTVGRVFDRASVPNGPWELEARIKGDSPDILFMQNGGEGYTASISPRDTGTELALWVDNSREDTHTYEWSWSSDRWYLLRVSGDGEGIYFAKLWPEDEGEPADWQTFMIDRTYTNGGMGVLVDTAGEEIQMDYIRLHVQEATG